MAFSIRLDEETEKVITRLARQRRQTKAAVVREALAAYGAAQAAVEPQSAAAALAPFIGIANSGGSRRSENTGIGFRELINEKRVRRPR